MMQLIEYSDISFMFDNYTINQVIRNKFKQETCGFSDYNHLITEYMDIITTPMRHFGDVNGSFRKICTSLIPLPRLKFMTPTLAPL